MNHPKILTGDCRKLIETLPPQSVQCCVTSPPYFGLRDYGHPDQIGQEKTPQEFVESMRQVFAAVWRVLKSDGTLWLNLGDSYARSGGVEGGGNRELMHMEGTQSRMCKIPNGSGLKPKDLCGIPWRVALALQSDGWYMRSDIIWSKPNPMPESVTDRPTRSHEYIFLLTKSDRYYYNHEAIKEPPSPALLKQISEGYNGSATKDFTGGMAQDASETKSRIINGYRAKIDKQRGHSRRHDGFNDRWGTLTKEEQMACGSNKRDVWNAEEDEYIQFLKWKTEHSQDKKDVWNVAPANFKDSHFATFPPDLIKPCILAGTKPGDTVLDLFGGSGTTGMVALELGRKTILIELNPDYSEICDERCHTTPGLALA